VANIKISLLNRSTALTDKDVSAALPAFQTQVHRDFAPVWGVDADLAFVPSGKQPVAGSWQLGVFDNSDQAGALGYHDLTQDGLPLGKVFAQTDQQYGYKWTVTCSHELLEMLGDPDINLTAFVLQSSTTGRLYAYEVADACEADQYGYQIDGVTVSDFVYPAWFESFRGQGSTQFDYGNHITEPFALLPGGYIGVFDVGSGSGWTQITAQGVPHEYQMRPRVGSRRERRRTPRDQWLKSSPKR
jgi:hypothetical protein